MITPLPEFGNRATDTPQEFSDKTDTALNALPTFGEELNDTALDVEAMSDDAIEAADDAAEFADAAADSAAAALLSEGAAETAEENAEAAFLAFDKRFLGVKTSDPTLDNQGDALQVGAQYYYNGTGQKGTKVYNGTTWFFGLLPEAAYALLAGAAFTGLLEAQLGLKINGAATLGTTAIGVFDLSSSICRYFVGDGTAGKFRFAKRVSSTTTDLIEIDDTGKMSFLANNIIDALASHRVTPTAMAALAINCSLNNYFTKTISGNSTFTVSNVPSSREYTFKLTLTHTSGTITWFSGVIWPNGNAPVLTTGKVHEFWFTTQNGGTTWRASVNPNYAS